MTPVAPLHIGTLRRLDLRARAHKGVRSGRTDEQKGVAGNQPRWIEGMARRRESQHSPMARTVRLSPGVQEPPAGAAALFRAPSCGGEGRFYVAGAAALLAGCSCVLSGGRASSHLVPSPPAEGNKAARLASSRSQRGFKKKIVRLQTIFLASVLRTVLLSISSPAPSHFGTLWRPLAPTDHRGSRRPGRACKCARFLPPTLPRC